MIADESLASRRRRLTHPISRVIGCRPLPAFGPRTVGALSRFESPSPAFAKQTGQYSAAHARVDRAPRFMLLLLSIMSSKVIVLHSGGLDSTLCLLRAQRKGHSVISLGIDYGQKHRVELEYAKQQCERFNVVRKVLRVEWDKPVLHVPENRTVDEMRRSVSPAFLPGRNAVFLTLACAEAAGAGAAEVWIGVNAVDFSGYPDCRPAFIQAFRKMVQKAIPNGPRIVAPLLYLSKPQIARSAYRLGLRRGDVWCCYRPELTARGVEPCGRCDACLLHEHAWNEGLPHLRARSQ